MQQSWLDFPSSSGSGDTAKPTSPYSSFPPAFPPFYNYIGVDLSDLSGGS